MLDKNDVTLRGHLVEDAVTSSNPAGVAFANLRMATNRRWKDAAGQSKEEATFHSVVVVGRQAEFIRTRGLKKGTRVEVEGYIRNRSWDGKDGQKRYKTEVVAGPNGFTDMTPHSQNQPDGYAAEF